MVFKIVKIKVTAFLFIVLSSLSAFADTSSVNSAQRAVQRGIQLAQAGSIKEAIVAFQQAIELNPRDASVYLYLNRAYQEIDALDEALQACRTAVELRPDFADAHHEIGKIAHQKGQLEDAVKAYQQAIELKPKTAVFHYDLGTVYHTLGHLSEAEAEYQRALRLNSELAAVHQNLGALYQKQGKVNAAIDAYQQALKHEPDRLDTRKHLKEVEEERTQLFHQAILKAQTAIAMQPDSAENYRRLGLAYYHSGRADTAIEVLKIALHLEPKSERRRADLDKVTTQKAEYVRKGIEFYNRQSAEIRDNSALGVLYAMDGQLEMAVKHFRLALKSAPDDVFSRLNLGETLYEQDKLKQAYETFQHALQLQPELAKAHQKSGIIAVQQGKFAKAVRHLQHTNSINPTDATTHYYLGQAYQKQDKHANATMAYQTAVRLKPDFALAYLHLADVYVQYGKLRAGVEFYRKFISLAAPQPDLGEHVAKAEAKIDTFMKHLTDPNPSQR